MIKRIVYIVLLAGVIQSCGSDSKAEVEDDASVKQAKDNIALIEKEMMQLSEEGKMKDLDNKRNQLNDSLLGFYNNHPDNEYAAQCLEKLHMSYLIQRDILSAVSYGDTLINKYPDHPNRLIIIESLSNIYDMDIKPRNKQKVKYYLEMLLKDYPEMEEEKKADIQYRLDNIDKSIEQIMHEQLMELN